MEEQEPINQITEPLKPVNLPYGVPDWVGKYDLPYKSYAPGSNPPKEDYLSIFDNLMKSSDTKPSDGFKLISTEEIDSKYPSFVPGLDNEELYAQNQSTGEKWKNGIVKMSGLATATFVQGTAGLVYGTYKWIQDGKFNSFYNNELSNNLNDWTTSQEDKYAHYKTQREINGEWWEPSNLFTANFWADNVVKNLGFAIGAIAGGFGWGAVLKGIGLTARLTGMGAKMAASADDVIAASIKASAAQRLPTALNGLQKAWNGAKSTIGTGVMSTDRAIVATFATAGESGIEALHNSKEFRESLIEEFKNTRGYSPTQEDIEEINRYAESVGNTVYGLNTALLTITNYIMLPKMFSSSFKGERRLANNMILKGEKYASSLPQKGVAGALYKGSKIAGLTFSKEEAFEEGAQFGIQVGVDNYFHKKLQGYNNLSVLDEGILTGIKETLGSSEGWLNITIGGLSGAIMTGVGKVRTRGFTGSGGREGKLRNEAITALNGSLLKDKLRSAYTNVKAAEIIQEEREAAIRRGDILESKDLEFDYAHNFVETRLKYNAKEAIDFEIQQLKEEAATEEGFLALQQEGRASETDTRRSFIARLDNLQKHANLASNLHQALSLKYGSMINEKTGKKVYSDKSIEALVYAATKIQNYDDRLTQLSTELLENGVDPQALLLAENRDEYVKSVLESIDVVKKDDVSEKLTDFLELERRKKIFAEQYESIKNEPSAYKDDVAETEELEAKVTSVPEEQREKITLKTKDGEEEIEIGTEYYLGKTVTYDKNGKEIHAFPTLIILAKNEDGTIKIKDSEGNVRDVDPSVLVDYKLGKVSDTLSNKKAKFYKDNVNTIFQFNFGKGKKKNGRLEYFPKKGILLFVYKDDKGKRKEIEVTGDQFVAQKGFTNPMISNVGKLTVAQQKALESFTQEKDERVDAKREVRMSILDQLFEELTSKQEVITKLIQQKKNQVNEIIEQLASLEDQIKNAEFDKRSKKALRFKSQAKKALEATMVLSRMKDQLEKEIEDLRVQEEELELNATYVADMAQNIDELPTDSSEFIEELKEQRDLLKDAVLDTGLQINALSSLIGTIEDTIDQAVSFLGELIDEFKKKYPKVPLALGQEWVEFLKANPNFLKRKPNYKEDLKELENLIADIEDTDITLNEEKLKEYKDKLTDLYKQLNEVGNELTAKELILSRFEAIAEEFKKKKEQEQLLVKNKQLIEKLIGTHTKEDPNNVSEKDYQAEAKKSDNAVINGTVAIDDGKPHQKRANLFGINLKNFPKELRASLRAIEITEKTEGLAGIPGLIKHLLGDTKKESNTVVAVIFVKDEGDGKFSFIDENGEVITDNLIDKAIYQVRPTEKLEKNYSDVEGEYDMQTMFRSSTPKEVEDELRNRYAKTRAAVLASDTLQPMKEFTASLGILNYEQKPDEKGEKLVNDYGAKNAVEDTELVSEDDLSDKLLLEIPTLNDPTPENGVKFLKAIGRIFLRIPGVGLIKLNSGKVSRKKAETIYEVITKVAKNINEDPQKGGEKSKYLFDWLRTVVYWGVQRDPNTKERKEPTTNSVWFEEAEGVVRLFIGKEGNNFVFTPSSLEANKPAIISALEEIHHNVSNSELKKNKKYIEILGFNKEGEAETKAWDNYQSYLLSKEGRKANEIPLTTPILAIKGTNKTNRKGIYFVLQDNIESEVAQKKAPEQKKEEEQPVSEKPEIGKITTFTSSDGNVIYFTLNEEGYIVLKPGGDIKVVAEKLTKFYKDKNPEASDAEIRELVNDAISKKIVEHYAKPKTEERSIFGKKTKPVVEEEQSEEKEQKPAEVKVEGPKKSIFSKGKAVVNEDDEVLREKIVKEATYLEENWKSVETWLKANFPNIPVYRVKNAIVSSNGKQAWGMLHKGAIYLTENAESGTAYHEVFEAVWKMMTPKDEQSAILNEFRARKGTFKNRFTGETITYSEASDFDIKEELAEEFRDYVLYKKIPAKPTAGKPFIVKLFSDIYNFLKAFFTGEKAQINTANLFEKIGTGYYKSYNQYESSLSFAKQGIIDIDEVSSDENSEFRLKIPYVYKHELMQHMTYSMLSELIRNNASLFNIARFNKKDIYEWLKDEVLSIDLDNPGILQKKFSILDSLLEEDKLSQTQHDNEIDKLTDMYEKISENWDTLIEEHSIYLKQYSIEFDENDNLFIENKEDKGADGHPDARKVDSFRKTNPAVKLLLVTIPEVEYQNGKIRFKRNSIGGISTLPLDKTFITLKNKLYNSINVEDMLSRLREIAKDDINYRTLYARLTKKGYNEDSDINFDSLNEIYDIELLSAFYKAMKAQNPEVKIVYILPSGEVEIGDAHLSSAVRVLKYEMFTDIQQALKSKNPYVAFDVKTKTYNATSTIKNLKLDSGNAKSYMAFLKTIGIEVSKKEIETFKRKGQLKVFEDAVNGIKTGIENLKELKDINKYSFDLEGRLMALSALKASILNPEFESTYFNINGEHTQTYIGTNLLSDLYNVLSGITNKKELVGTQYEYLLTDSFSQNSVVLDLMFNPKTGNKRPNAESLLSVGIVEGIVDETKNKSKESSKVTSKERLIQELNLNSKGWFLNLVPGDASIEWMVKLFHDPFISSGDLKLGYNDSTIFSTFKNHFIAEVNTAREGRDIVTVGDRNSSDLRFFKVILGKKLHDSIVKDTTSSAEEVYNNHKKEIDNAVKAFIKNKAEERFKSLEDYGIVGYNEEGIEAENLSFVNPKMSKEDIIFELEALEANYVIANIELHKIVYSDPYFYKDELKRTKNFNSPAQDLLNSPRINEAIDTIYNKGFSKNTLGWTNFTRSYLVSATIADITSFLPDVKDYEGWTETDGGGIITMQAYRKVRIKSANWTERDEKQYQFDIKYEKLVKSGATKEQITKFSEENPSIKSAYTPIKPIVRGSKQDGNSYNDIVLDKFALVPFSFRILHQMNPKSNALKHYQRMIDSDVDYTVFDSGRKVGGKFKNPLYETDGTYVTAPFLETSDISFDIFKIQTEVPSKDKPEVTQGSQITKLVTMDFMDAGVPLDFQSGASLEDRIINWMKLSDDQKLKASEIYSLIKNNETLLIERIQHGYDTLLEKLGIEQKGTQFRIKDRDKLVDTLTSEIYKREVNDNIISAFKGFKSGEVILEATPAYQQIRNILYSIANKQVTRPTISGGLKVQVQSTLLESVRAKVDEKGRYISDNLNFYELVEDGKKVQVAEIMVGRWFSSDMTDSQLLDYLNNTEEGQKILKGVAFRIPTQKQNTIDVFKIKQFLPTEFGDSVIVPSAIVNKAGSDFDIDKLSIYFKNVYKNLKGEIKAVPFFGYGQKAKDELGEMFDNGDFLSEKDRKKAIKWIENRKIEDRDDVVDNLFKSIFGEQMYDDTYVQEVMDDLLESRNVEELRNKIVNEKYRQSLENQYIESLEQIVSHPSNFENLVRPNSAEQLKTLASEINGKLGIDNIDYSSAGAMLDRAFMERLRQAFVGGRYAIGIAATSQTNNAQNQRAAITIDYDRLQKQTDDDKKWLGNAIVKFKKFNKLKGLPTLSISRSQDGSLISDIIGMFIDGYVDIAKGPWIMELGATPNVASTWLFLIKLGVPIKTVAYFMNQPIIKEHLSQLENAGYTWIFNDRIYNDTISNYSTSAKIDTTTLPSEDDLGKMVGKDVSKMTEKEKAQQVFIFNEFFKYSKLGEHLFHVQQASNHDTANLNDPFLVFKKEMQIERARTTMISSVDDLLNTSFVGSLRNRIKDIRNAFSEILISDRKGGVREVLENVLLPYIDASDKDFIKISQKAVVDLFDWAVQNNTSLNSKLQSVLLGSEDRLTAAQQIMNFVKEVKRDDTHPLHNNYIINSIRQSTESVNDNKPHNLYLAGKNNKTYDQNNAVYGFSEIKDYLENQGELSLYRKLVDLAVLQSGLSNSKISFSHLLPYEDFKDVYNESLSMLSQIPNLEEFLNLDVFERNNWNNQDIVPSKKSKWLKLKEPFIDYFTGMEKKWIKVPEIEFLPKVLRTAINKKTIPQLIQLSKFSKEGNEDFVVFSWEKDISKQKKQEMRKKGDYSYIQKGLFKKVYGSDELPLISSYTSKKGITYESYIFKPINAWGDSYRANEFYTTAQESKIDNGFIKVKEVEDTVIENIMYPSDKKQPKKETERDISAKTINIYAGTNENAELSNFAIRPFVSDLGKFNTVEGAFQAAKDVYSDVNNPETLKLPTATGSQAKAIGRNLKGVKIAEWDKASSRIMKELLKQSFEQNPNALAKLLATGNATLTHTQDKGKWGTEFPKLLMEVREELKNEDPLTKC